MTIELYLPSLTWNYIDHIGNYDDVINAILKLGAEGQFDICNKPPAPSIQSTKYAHRSVFINDTDFLESNEIYSTKSCKNSLRRLIFWFFDNEMTYLLYPNGTLLPTISPNKKKLSSDLQNINKILYILHKNLKLLSTFVANNAQKEYYDNIKNNLNNLQESLINKGD